MYPKPYRNKFNARKTILDGIAFPSQLEADTYAELKMEERAGLIKEITLQDRVQLTEAPLFFKIDFKYLNLETKEYEWAEAKGQDLDRWRVALTLWPYYGPGRLRIFKRMGKRLIVAKTINPEKK